MNIQAYGLGRKEPKDFIHITKFPYQAEAPFTVEKLFVLPVWHQKHNQGQEGACVGHGTAMAQAILNLIQCFNQGASDSYIRYNPWWLWDEAKRCDGDPETNPGDNNGTTVSAAMDVLRKVGVVLWPDEDDRASIDAPNLKRGLKENRWATTADDVRAAIAADKPVTLGVPWYSDFDEPQFIAGEWWIGSRGDLGRLRGGHCTCIYGASDARQAVRIKNSWGPDYPEVWLSYKNLERLLRENGEASLVTDL